MSDTLALISEDAIDEAMIERFVMTSANGALVTFRGVVRDHDHGAAVSALDYQAHPDALRFLQRCCDTVAERTGLRVAAAHRVGSLAVGDVALVAAVAAPHRSLAFEACQSLVDLVKSEVPIWKRQHLADGVSEWVGL
ncbi:MAG: molybdenum cofactor biosynthesis protein MoaE [Actinomycetota bacterium]